VIISASRSENFNVVRRLNNPEWDEEKNLAVFGKANNKNFQGQSYKLTVTLSGEPNPKTGYVYDIKLLKDIIIANVISLFDSKNLNLDTPFFKKTNPTIENLAVVIWEILRLKIEAVYELKIKIKDAEGNSVEYSNT